MNDQNEKIIRIKQIRLLQECQYDIEKELCEYLKNGNKIENIKKIILNNIIDKTYISPKIEINYDKNTYNIIVKLDNIGLKILINNNDYDI